jgi:hypothetical protein
MGTRENQVSVLLWNFIHKLKGDHFTLEEMAQVLKDRSFAIVILLMALPNACFLTLIPGTSMAFGAVLVVTSLQMIQRRSYLWLPQRLGSKTISKKGFSNILRKSEPYLLWIEKHLKHRYQGLVSEKSNLYWGVFVLINGMLIMLPIPFANNFPAFALVLLSIGILAKDGLCALIGLALGVPFWLCLALLYGFFLEKFKDVVHFFFSFL